MTIRVLGIEWPVIRKLTDDWFLVRHPNGPAIARCWDATGDGGLLASPAHPHGEIPEAVRAAAVEAMIEEFVRLFSVLEASRDYIAGVNADWPNGQDDERDELIDRIEAVLIQTVKTP